MNDLKDKVTSLYEYRDHFFNLNNISESSEKPRLVNEKLAVVLKEFENVDSSMKNRAEYLMLKGKALNITDEHNEEAEMLLSKAVKLDPGISEAWTCLGECYWKKEKLDSAKDCFVSSISHQKNKEALRNLSIIIRAMSKDKKSIEDSVQMAKEALEMDLNDGLSWLTFGNAYLALYFCKSQDLSIIKQALFAYSRAEQDKTTQYDYSLYFNKASALEYMEDFNEALTLYHRANELKPTFIEGQSKERRLLKYLSDVNSLIHTRGNIRAKRLKLLVSKIKPFPDTSYPNPSTNCFKTLQQLSEGENTGCTLLGRVVGSVMSEDRVCHTFCLVDKDATCVAVMLYNASSNWNVCIGDAVLIHAPRLKHISIHLPSNPPCTSEAHIDFPSIRVNSPNDLLINTRKVTNTAIAPTTMSQIVH